MFGRIKFLVIYFLAWVLFFELSRAVFLLYHYGQTRLLTTNTIFSTFIYGLRMDLSMSSYIALPACLFVLASVFISFFRKAVVYTIYTAIILFFLICIIGADLELYSQWNFRIDDTPLKFLNTPQEMWASVSHLPIALIVVLLLFVYGIVFLSFRYLIKKTINHLENQVSRILAAIFVLVFTCSLIIPLRGGLQLAPINQSSVYFSKVNFANHASINAPWNFLYAILHSKNEKGNPYIYMDHNEAKRVVDSLYVQQDVTIPILKSDTPNIILIIWESSSAKALDGYNGKAVLPHLTSLKKEGVYFNNVYASGDRTDKGLSAILSGYPALPASSIIRLPNKASKLEFLPQLFKLRNYSTPFYYGGETEFANIKSYLLHGGAEPIIDKNEFSKKDQNSKWGAHDGVVAKRLLIDLKKQQQPFFTTWLTLSSHEPYEIPESPLFSERDYTSQYLSSLHYTDKVIYDLVTACKEQPWWRNTLVIIIADHGHPLPETSKKINNFKIPMIWLGGALQIRDTVIDKVISQTDLATTLVRQLGIYGNHFPFSKDIFATNSKEWSLFRFKDGFGFVTANHYYIFDNIGKQIIESNGNITDLDLKAGKAMQQTYYEDFLKK